jgi:hypothetical protein
MAMLRATSSSTLSPARCHSALVTVPTSCALAQTVITATRISGYWLRHTIVRIISVPPPLRLVLGAHPPALVPPSPPHALIIFIPAARVGKDRVIFEPRSLKRRLMVKMQLGS